MIPHITTLGEEDMAMDTTKGTLKIPGLGFVYFAIRAWRTFA
jgi:hypothetical protein